MKKISLVLLLFLVCFSCTKDDKLVNERPYAPTFGIDCNLPYFIFEGTTSHAMFSCNKLQKVPLSIIVVDKENDPIIYKWTSTSGSFENNSDSKSQVVWIAPSQTTNCETDAIYGGQYQHCKIEVSVSDASNSNTPTTYYIEMYINCNL